MTLSEGGPVTAALSDLTTTAELTAATAFNPTLLGTYSATGNGCTSFLTTSITVPTAG